MSTKVPDGYYMDGMGVLRPHSTEPDIRQQLIRCLSIVQTYDVDANGEAAIELEADHLLALISQTVSSVIYTPTPHGIDPTSARLIEEAQLATAKRLLGRDV